MADAASATVIEPARPDELIQVFHAFYAHLDGPQQAFQVERLRQCLETEEITPDGILVARRAGELMGAIVCTFQQGASGLLWLPRLFALDATEADADALVQAAHVALRRAGCKMSQTVLRAEEMADANVLLRNGFIYVTRMHWLRHNLGECDADRFPIPASLTFQTPHGAWRPVFEATLLQTYEGSPDFPELNDVRTVEEILAGHQTLDEEPETWWLVLEQGQPVGVLLVADLGEPEGWELSYVGLIPGARGRGLGKAMTRFALNQMRRRGASRLTVTVDERNLAARHLYGVAGFAPAYEREVLLCVYDH